MALGSKDFDVIILDLDMPIMNGFEACIKIRKGDENESIQELFRIENKRKGISFG